MGAGPGDPGLLTLRGKELLEQADVVVYDRLAHPALLQYAPNAEHLYVGKSSSRHTMPQMEISRLLVDRALTGQRVVRLKGGDSFVFGRGGEELEACVEAGIPFEVVPGITSAIAAPAYAGIPVSHRHYASAIAIITGHRRDEADTTTGEEHAGEKSQPAALMPPVYNPAAPWTLIYLMGVENLPQIIECVKTAGYPVQTPAALIQWGTRPNQRVVAGPLDRIQEIAQEGGIQSPAITVIGEVVQLRQTLRWFDNRPLFGKRILVTRAREQASELSVRLRLLGAEPIEYPMIKIQPLQSDGLLDSALKRLKDTDWVIFTSANGVRAVANRMMELKLDARIFGSCKIAAIGPATDEALHTVGLWADFVPSRFVAESLLEELPEHCLTNRRILIVRAKEARDVLPDGLAAKGAQVEVIPAYETVPDAEGASELINEILNGQMDVITFASSSTVRNLAAALAPKPMSDLAGKVVVASIGPVTSKTATELGLPPDIEAPVHTIPGLVEAILSFYSERKAEKGRP